MRRVRAVRAFGALIAAAGLATLGTGCGARDASDANAGQKVVTIGARDVASVEQVRLESGVPISGTLEPVRVADVKAQVGGTITGVRIDAGSAVGSGQALGTIAAESVRSMATTAKASIGAAEANVNLAKQRLESLRALFQTGAVSKIEVDNAATGLEAALAQLTAAKANAASAGEQVARTVVRAPLSGIVSARLVNDGEAVTSGQKLFTVVNNSSLELAGKVPAESRGEIRVGQQVMLRPSAAPERSITGRVVRIEPVADLQTRQVGVHVQIPNPGGVIVAGQYVNGRIQTSGSGQLATVVPLAALRNDARGDHVFIVQANHVVRREVKPGPRDEARGIVAIESGLRTGDVVLVSPTVDITPQTEVRVASDDASGTGTAPAGRE